MTYQQGLFVQAICLFNKLVVQDQFEEFLTTPAYKLITVNNAKIFSLEEAPKTPEEGSRDSVRKAV